MKVEIIKLNEFLCHLGMATYFELSIEHWSMIVRDNASIFFNYIEKKRVAITVHRSYRA